MFKPIPKGICKQCGKERPIVVKAYLCRICNESNKALKKANRGISRPKKQKVDIKDLKKLLRPKKKRKVTGELSVFAEIWAEREHICQVTGVYIRRFTVDCMSHILSKAAYPSERLNKENIWIVLPSIHQQWETGDRNDPIFDKKRAKYEELKQQYYAKTKKTI